MEKLVQALSGPSIDSLPEDSHPEGSVGQLGQQQGSVEQIGKPSALRVGCLLGGVLLLVLLGAPSGAAFAAPPDSPNGKANAYGRDAENYPGERLGRPAGDGDGVATTSALVNPIASFTYTTTGLTVDVDASGSSDPDGTIVAYDWDFGDGGTATGIIASHTYAQAGTFTVTLTVTDDLGAMDSTEFVITAREPNQPPIAGFTHSLTLLAISVDAQPSFDPEGRIDEYMWDFGDGGTATGITASHTYANGRTYPVTLTVSDYSGATGSVAPAITIPSAFFTYSVTNLTVFVDNAGQGPTIVSYDWDFGDGGTATGISASHSYAQPGTYTVTHTVTDNLGATDSTSFVVTARAPNQPPVAGFTFLLTGLTVDVSAQPSSDPEGRIDDYQWDFGDGTTASGVEASHTFVIGGAFTVQLTVSDYAGATDVTSVFLDLTTFVFTPPKHYHVNEGSALNFTVTAGLGGAPLTVTATGLPPLATFDGVNFSWVGQFETMLHSGRYDVTFSAGGESEVVTIGTTAFALLTFDMFLSPTEPVTGPVVIPEGGQTQVLAQAFFENPFGDPSPIAGQGTNAWSNILWFISDTAIASLSTSTNVAVIDGVVPGTAAVSARFTDADLGEMAAIATLDVLEIVGVAVDPVSLTFPNGSTEVYAATATLSDASETQDVQFFWNSSNESIATVTPGEQVFGTGHLAFVRGQSEGTATISAFVQNAAMVSGSGTATLVAPLRNQELYGADVVTGSNQIVIVDTLGGSQLLATMLAPYTERFGPLDSHTNNDLLVSGFEAVTGFSQIQRIFSAGAAVAVFTSDSTTQQGDTIDPQALRYRPDGWAYFAMSEGQQTLSRIDPAGSISNIGGPSNPGQNEGFGPTGIAPFGNDLVYSGPWSFDLTQGQTVGFAELIARFDDVANSNDSFVWPDFSFPRMAAPGGDLRILDATTGELFRFEDTNLDGDHFEIVGTTLLTAQDDPNERFAAGQLPSGFVTLSLDHQTGDMITTRIVGTAPQRIMVMRLTDLNDDGVIAESEQTVVFDAGAPPGTDIRAVVLRH